MMSKVESSMKIIDAKIHTMYLLDQTWVPFSNLMLRHIYNVLLICSDYDRFMLEEDGRVEEELYNEYTDLGLSNPPKITHVNNENEALEALRKLKFDLVISMLDLESGKVEKLAEDVKKLDSRMPFIVLSPSPDHRKAKELKGTNCPYIDYMFYWQGSPSLFLAMIKLIEDQMNIDHDTKEADVQVIILVEDSVRFISSYLPQIYTCLIHQNRTSILEAMNEWGKTLRMRGRPKIVLAQNLGEAWQLYLKYEKNVLGVISDVSFPGKSGKEEAGFELSAMIRERSKEVPILIQSREKQHQEKAKFYGLEFIWKLSPSLFMDLEKYFLEFYNFGPFIFKDPATGKEIGRAETMKEVQRYLKTIPIESFVYHSRRNDFSRWLRAQSLYRLASMIKGINLNDKESSEETRLKLYNTIRDYRSERSKGIIATFSKDHYDETLHFSRIGKGSLGGKGRGLAFISMEMHANKASGKFPSYTLSVPRTVVVTTEYFDQFMQENDLLSLYFIKNNDEEILKLFLSKNLPKRLSEELSEVIKFTSYPLSVRSSSLLEDSHFQPFAGVYQTSMIPNIGSFEDRLEDLEKAVKTVWASTYSKGAREYLERTEHGLEEEKMSVIIEEAVGKRRGRYFFPWISGVARSLNYYPTPGQSQEDGIALLALGFGKTIVDGGRAFRFSPGKPKKPAVITQGISKSPQDSFYALDMERKFNPLENTDNLVSIPLEEILNYKDVQKGTFSTIESSTGMLSESRSASGEKILTFNGIIKYDMFPLAKVVFDMLRLGQKAMAEPVEIEFAVEDRDGEANIVILQIRPISSSSGGADIEITENDRKNAFVYAKTIMGNGIISGLRDIVAIKLDAFRKEETLEMAKELELINEEINSEYLLIVAGRLGSSDRWLGIPCIWSQISKARVIVETGIREMDTEPSQGTHFFQNLTSLGTIYMNINPIHGDGMFTYDKLEKLEIAGETKHFLHLYTRKDLTIKVSARTSEAIISI